MHNCSICKVKFSSVQEYLNHTCSTGFPPTDIRHQEKLNPNYKEISKAALKRGKEQKKK